MGMFIAIVFLSVAATIFFWLLLPLFTVDMPRRHGQSHPFV
jgi:hypothetical protein